MSRQCLGIAKRDGRQCGNWILTGEYCYHHWDQVPTIPKEIEKVKRALYVISCELNRIDLAMMKIEDLQKQTKL